MRSVFVIKLCLNSKQVAKGQRSMPENQLLQSLVKVVGWEFYHIWAWWPSWANQQNSSCLNCSTFP